jgi:hypothetical protein
MGYSPSTGHFFTDRRVCGVVAAPDRTSVFAGFINTKALYDSRRITSRDDDRGTLDGPLLAIVGIISSSRP